MMHAIYAVKMDFLLFFQPNEFTENPPGFSLH